MKVLSGLIISLAIWYGVFVFLTNEFNPMEWKVWIKLIGLLIVYIVFKNTVEGADSTF